MFTFGSKCSAPYKLSITVNGTPIDMEIDTGASVSVLSEGVYWDLHSKRKLPHLDRGGTKNIHRGGSETKGFSRCHGIP